MPDFGTEFLLDIRGEIDKFIRARRKKSLHLRDKIHIKERYLIIWELSSGRVLQASESLTGLPEDVKSVQAVPTVSDGSLIALSDAGFLHFRGMDFCQDGIDRFTDFKKQG